MFWSYYPDGALASAVDRQGHRAGYLYDRNDNLTMATDARSQGREPITLLVESEFNGYDEQTKSRIKRATDANWRFTRYTYDRNGNLDTRKDDGLETGAGAELEPPRLHDYAYNEVDELTEHLDLGTDGQLPNEGDRKLARNYEKTGWLKDETLSRHTNGGWSARRSTAWTYFVSGDLQTLTTRPGSVQNPTIVEKHTLDYEQCPDPDEPCLATAKLYMNGNRTRDAFQLSGPTGPMGDPTGCENPGVCAMDYSYGPRENLTEEKRVLPAPSGTTWMCHTFDPAQNIDKEWIRTVDCDVEPLPLATRDFDYSAGNRLTQLTDRSQGLRIHKYFYDDDGSLDCVTSEVWMAPACPGTAGQGAIPNATLEEDLDWHYSGKLASFRRFDNGSSEDWADYDHDPLDRLYREAESHLNSPTQTTSFVYRGASDLVRAETTGGTEKSYTYSLEGAPLVLDSGPAGGAPALSRAYAANVHTDVSLLLSLDSGSSQVQASYGYKAYGHEDANLTQGTTTEVQRNPYRFNAKRLDTGSATLDMGARRYNSTIARFVQRDFFADSSQSDVSLDIETLTQNRYSVPISNPITYVEHDGHAPVSRTNSWNPECTPVLTAFASRRYGFAFGNLAGKDPKNITKLPTFHAIRVSYWTRLNAIPGFHHCHWLVQYRVTYYTTGLGSSRNNVTVYFGFTYDIYDESGRYRESWVPPSLRKHPLTEQFPERRKSQGGSSIVKAHSEGWEPGVAEFWVGAHRRGEPAFPLFRSWRCRLVSIHPAGEVTRRGARPKGLC